MLFCFFINKYFDVKYVKFTSISRSFIDYPEMAILQVKLLKNNLSLSYKHCQGSNDDLTTKI